MFDLKHCKDIKIRHFHCLIDNIGDQLFTATLTYKNFESVLAIQEKYMGTDKFNIAEVSLQEVGKEFRNVKNDKLTKTK